MAHSLSPCPRSLWVNKYFPLRRDAACLVTNFLCFWRGPGSIPTWIAWIACLLPRAIGELAPCGALGRSPQGACG